MVRITNILLGSRKKKKFLDNIRVFVKGGTGGNGLSRYGGVGGNGGSVYAEATDNTLLQHVIKQYPKKRLIAPGGESCRINKLVGNSGEDVIVEVPVGVTVFNDSGRKLGELNEAGERVLLIKGGQGGCMENGFKGGRSQSYSVRFDLKLIADVGLVGFPNAGKSTLLSTISRSSPKIASYAFTTIQPQIGTMMFDDMRQITVADLPGLIEGAHVNFGMGHSFLKHIERTKVLLFVVDIHGFQLNYKHKLRSAVETLLLLNKELELYKDELVHKPAVLALNKVDCAEGKKLSEEVMMQLENINDLLPSFDPAMKPSHLMKFDEVCIISAKEKQGTENLKEVLRAKLDQLADLEYDALMSQEGKTYDFSNRLEENFKGTSVLHQYRSS